MEKIYWVGPRQSDMEAIKDIEFCGSVTLFGDGTNNNHAFCLENNVNRVNHNLSDKAEDEWFKQTIVSLIKKDSSVKFYFYNPNMVYYIPGLDAYKKNFVCVNPKDVMEMSKDKLEFYNRLEGKVPLLRKQDGHRNNCDYVALQDRFEIPSYLEKRFIFQAKIASGGAGTYLVSRSNVKDVVNLLTDDNYILTVYEENNIPVNIHAIIFDDEILLTAGSIQIMKEDDYRLLYRGADFIAYRSIDADLRKQFEDNVRNACKVYQQAGYRGVCGVDGIILSRGIRLLELNNRFQASSGLINMALMKAGLPSIQTVNRAAFEGKWDEKFRAIESAEVNFSNFFFTDNGTLFHSRAFHETCKNMLSNGTAAKAHVVALEDDGFQVEQNSNSLAYLFRVVFDTNIVAVTAENKIHVDENICEPDKTRWYDVLHVQKIVNLLSRPLSELKEYLLYLKVALLVQGVNISKQAEQFITERGGLRPATNNAIDIRIDLPVTSTKTARNKYIIINTPTDIKFVEFSPFKIDLDGQKLVLYYYGEAMTEIGFYPVDPVAFVQDEQGNWVDRYTTAAHNKKSVPYSEVGFLSTDRLRVHLTNSCIFKHNGNGCKFCNIKPVSDVLDLANIEEVVREYCSRSAEIGLRHFLVGGQTAPNEDVDKIVEIIKIIRKNAPFAEIYAMVIPYPEETIKKMYQAGMNQLSCNIEVFDDEIAAKIMPGKRKTSKSLYVERLKYATRFMGRKGNVRSMVIVGLEPHKSLIRGVEELASNGIQPILSIFRPLPDTEMENLSAPSMLYLVDAYKEIQAICQKYELSVGPKCVNCQNNTLALPDWLDR